MILQLIRPKIQMKQIQTRIHNQRGNYEENKSARDLGSGHGDVFRQFYRAGSRRQ